MILIFSGMAATYLAFFLIKKFEPPLAIMIACVIMSTAGFIYPAIHTLSRFKLLFS